MQYQDQIDVEEDLEYAEKGKMPPDMLSRMRSARQYRSTMVPMWDAAFEFLRGNQRIVGDPVSSRIGSLLGSERVRAISNRLLPIYRSTVASLAAQFPRFVVTSSSPSYDDTIKRIACNQCLSAWWRLNRMEHKWRNVVQWLSPGGNAALWTYYDPVEEKVCTEVIGCYDVVWEAEALSMDEADWCGIRRIMTRRDAIERWPDHEEFLKEMPSTHTAEGYEREYLPHDRLELWWIYFKDGRCGVWTGAGGDARTKSKSQWLEQSRTPENIFPIAFMRWTPIADRLYGMSQLFPLLDMQVQYNLYRNFMLESAKLMANPIWMIPKQANVNMNQITNRPGQAVFYNGNAVAPSRLPGPALSSDVYNVQNRQLMEMEDVGGIHNISMGKRAPGVTANVSMQTLIQQDSMGLAVTMHEMSRAMEESATHALVMWKAYMPKKKSIAILDPTFGITVTKELDKTNLIDAPEIEIEAGSMFAMNAKERDTQVLQLAQLGVIPPQDVIKHLSFTLDKKEELEKMQMLSHAQDLLEAVLRGHTIQIVEEPAIMMAIRNVFGEFIRSPMYYDKKPEAVLAAQQGDLDAQNALQALDNVWTIYQQVATQMQQAMQPQGGPTGSLPNPAGPGGGGPAPTGPDARPVLNDPMNPTAAAPESKGTPGRMGLP